MSEREQQTTETDQTRPCQIHRGEWGDRYCTVHRRKWTRDGQEEACPDAAVLVAVVSPPAQQPPTTDEESDR